MGPPAFIGEGVNISAQILFLLDRNIVSLIKAAKNGKETNDQKKLEMLRTLRRIDTPASAISPILSLIEGQLGKKESFEEKTITLDKEAEALRHFFSFARTDCDFLQIHKNKFASTFTEYREEYWTNYAAFLEEAFKLIKNKVPTQKRPVVESQIIHLARKHSIYTGSTIVVACLSCLHEGNAARNILKPHITPANIFNVLNDLLIISKISCVKAVANQLCDSNLKICFLTLDEGLRDFLEGLLIHEVELTARGVNIKLKFLNSLFPSLSETEYLKLLHKIC